MHRKVKDFRMSGVIADDSMFVGKISYYEKLLVDDMRERGYVPVLGMGPYFSTRYNAKEGNYTFLITVYGVFEGEKKSWKIEGVDMESGNKYPKSTPPNKSKVS